MLDLISCDAGPFGTNIALLNIEQCAMHHTKRKLFKANPLHDYIHHLTDYPQAGCIHIVHGRKSLVICNRNTTEAKYQIRSQSNH